MPEESSANEARISRMSCKGTSGRVPTSTLPSSMVTMVALFSWSTSENEYLSGLPL